MKPIRKANLLFQIAILAGAQSVVTPAVAQLPAEATKGADAAGNTQAPKSKTSPASATPAASDAPVTQSEAGAVSAAPRAGNAPAINNEAGAATPSVSSPEDAAKPTLAPLPPIANDNLDKKKGKKKGKNKGEKTRAAPQFGIDEDGDVSLGDPWGDSQDELRAAGLSFRFLAQAQYQQTFGVDSTNSDSTYRVPENTLAKSGDGWDLNRMFFRIMAEPSQYLGLKIVTDFAEFRHNNPKQAIKQANVELRPVPKHLHFVAGILKIPFEIFELDPIAKFEFASFGQANAMVSYLGFSGRDVGAEVIVSPLSKPRYLNFIAGAFRGHASDENASIVGDIAVRIESEPAKGFRMGTGWVGQPNRKTYLEPFNTSGKDLLPNPSDPSHPRSRTWDKGSAFGGDLTFNRWGLMLRTEGLIGTRTDYDTQYGATKWAAAWAIAAYKFPLGPIQLQPAVRAEVLDTDTQHSGGMRRQYSFALGAHFNRTTQLLFDITRTDVQANSPVIEQPLPLREIPYNDLSNVRVTARLQVTL
jgi:hypothetical protein